MLPEWPLPDCDGCCDADVLPFEPACATPDAALPLPEPFVSWLPECDELPVPAEADGDCVVLPLAPGFCDEAVDCVLCPALRAATLLLCWVVVFRFTVLLFAEDCCEPEDGADVFVSLFTSVFVSVSVFSPPALSM